MEYRFRKKVVQALVPALPLALLALIVLFAFRGGGLGPESNGDRRNAVNDTGPSPEAAVAERKEEARVSIEGFDEWVSAFTKKSAAGRVSMLAEGLLLAEDRREHLKALIESDPRAAIDAAVPYATRRELPAEVIARLETLISARGDYEMLVACFGDVKPEDSVSRFAVFGEDRYRAFPYGKRFEMTTKNGVSLHGIAIDDAMAVVDDPIRVLSALERDDRGFGGAGIAAEINGSVYAFADETVLNTVRESLDAGEFMLGPRTGPGYAALRAGNIGGVTLIAAAPGDEESGTEGGDEEAPESAHTEGPKTMLYIRARFSDQDPGFIPISNTNVNTRQAACEAFWLENSYGKSGLTTTITTTVTLTGTAAQRSSGGLSALLSDAAAAAEAADPVWRQQNYSFYTVLTSGGSFGYGGVAFVGGRGSHLNGSGAANVRTASHEFGHNLGLRHANYWRTDSPSPIGRDSVPGGYQNDNTGDEWIQYGHKFSVMSAQGGSGDFNSGRGHYTNGEKVKLDWLVQGDGDWVSINSSTATPLRLYRHDVPTADFGTMTPGVARGIKINVASGDYTTGNNSNKRRYWLNYRRLPTNGIAETWLRRGLQIDWQKPSYGSDGSILLDMTPFSRDSTAVEGNWTVDNNDKEDSALIIGRTFTDEVADIHITPTGQGGGNPNQWINVIVNIGTQGGNNDPVINSYTADDPNLQVGTNVAVNFTAAATDVDGDTVYYSWDFGDNSLVVASLNSTTATKSWGSAGYYPVRVTASDAKGGTDTKEIVIQVGNPGNKYQILGRVLHGGMPVEGARVNIGSTYQTWTEGDGSYALVGLPTGNRTVTAAKLGLTFTPQFTNPVNLTVFNAYGKDFWADEGLGGSGGLTLAVAPYEVTVPNGSTFAFTANGWDLAGNPVAASPSWSVSGGGTIDAAGVFTATTLGTHTVTAMDGAATTEAFVTVANINAISVTAIDAAAAEAGPDTATFRVGRGGTTSGNLTVQLSVGGTATAGSDYNAITVPVDILDGTSFTDVIMTPIDDFEAELAETVILTALPDGAYIIFQASATATITDDDIGPSVAIVSPARLGAAVPTGTGLFLEATASDDGLPNPPGALTKGWSVKEAPTGGSVVFSPPQGLTTVATFSVPGYYRIEFAASDSVNTGTAEIAVHSGVTPGTNPSTTNQLIHYALDEGTGNVAADAIGGDNTGVLSNGPGWTSSMGGISGSSVVFDGVDDYISIGSVPGIDTGSSHTQKTISLWFKPVATGTGAKEVLYEQGDATRGLNIYLEGNIAYVGGWNAGVNGWDTTFLSAPFARSQWHHVALVLDVPAGGALQADGLRMYFDGALVGAGEAAEMTSHSGNVSIGGARAGTKFHDGDFPGNGSNYAGFIDEFHYYNDRVLTIDEIGQQVGFGIAAPQLAVDSVEVNPGSVVIPSGVGVALDGTVTDPGSPVVAWTEIASPGGGSAAFGNASAASTTATFSGNGFYTLRLTADSGALVSAHDVNIHVGIDSPVNPSTANELIYYALDEGSGLTATDAIGGDNSGTFINQPGWTSPTGGVSGSSVVFYGVDEYISIANASEINTAGSHTQKSIALWFKPNLTATGAKETLYEQGGSTRGLNIYIEGDVLYVGGWNAGVNGWSTTYLSAPISRGAWHHVVLVLDVPAGGALQADGLRMILDGALAGAGVAAEMTSHTGNVGVGGVNSATKFHDGNFSGTGSYYAGFIDELHYFNGRVLSIDEIGQLYSFGNIGPLVDAGPDQLSAPALRAGLAGTSSDDGRWTSPVVHAWAVASGPGSAAFILPDENGIDTLGTFTAAGAHTLHLTANDGQVTTFDDVAITLTGVPYYDLFMDGFPSITGPDRAFLANPDSDPWINLEEYALQGRPDLGDSHDAIGLHSGMVEDGGQIYFEFRFSRRRDAALRGLTYTFQICDDLTPGSWSASGYTETGATVIDAEFEEATVRVDDPIGPGNLRKYGRLEIDVDE